jgi:hypothetical protein
MHRTVDGRQQGIECLSKRGAGRRRQDQPGQLGERLSGDDQCQDQVHDTARVEVATNGSPLLSLSNGGNAFVVMDNPFAVKP